MNSIKNTRRITGVAMLTALSVVFQVIGNLFTIGPVSINVSLIPIAMGAILYGPLAGLFLGVINGLVVIFSPATQAVFFSQAPLWTIVICLTKTGLAGLISGLVFKLFLNKSRTIMIIGMVISSMLVPLINTGIFFIAVMTAFKKILNTNGLSDAQFYATYFIAILPAFLSELIVNILLAPTIISMIKIITKKGDIGDNLETFNK